MMKMNRKGYMLVEIIVSFSIAFVIFISLTNLVLKFKDVNEKTYYETKYLKDKTLITRNIMDDLEKITITDVETTGNNILITTNKIEEDGSSEKRKLIIEGNTITYGKVNESGIFMTNDLSYYQKKLESSLKIKGIEDCSDIANKYFCTKIEITSIYSNDNYNLTFFSTNVG